MEKKTWSNPEVSVLGAENTELGNTIKTEPDAVIHAGGFTYYSFS